MACLPFYPRSPYKGKVFALLFSRPVHIAPPISKWLARPLPHSLSPGYRNKPRTHIQGRFSLTVRKLAHYTGSDCPLLHSNKLILLSFCLLSGNSFPSHTQTTTQTRRNLAKSFGSDSSQCFCAFGDRYVLCSRHREIISHMKVLCPGQTGQREGQSDLAISAAFSSSSS